MYLPISKKSRRPSRTKCARHTAKLKAKERRRVNGMQSRRLGRRR